MIEAGTLPVNYIILGERGVGGGVIENPMEKNEVGPQGVKKEKWICVLPLNMFYTHIEGQRDYYY